MIRKYSEYKILRPMCVLTVDNQAYLQESITDLERMVNSYIALGYEPFSSPFVAANQLCQAVIRYPVGRDNPHIQHKSA